MDKYQIFWGSSQLQELELIVTGCADTVVVAGKKLWMARLGALTFRFSHQTSSAIAFTQFKPSTASA
eukprot:252758-Prorocentrum_lima.AAC.1